MLGLIIKDFIQLKRIMKVFVGIAALYIILALMQGSNELMITFGVIACTMSGINSLAMDERSKWNEYAITLPYDRTQLVVAKYAMLAILAVICAVITMVMEALAFGMGKNVLEAGAAVVISCLICVALVLPFMYKFGIEKGRYILMAVALLPFVVSLLLENFGQKIPTEAIGTVFETLDKAPWLLCVIAMVLILGSLLISILICKKKEY